MTTMEDLTKTQIVLLTLLVSFITSIATGIITTSLLAQAPQNVTETIDRVVERTIERVAPTASTPSTTKEVTIVKEDDAIVSAVSSNTKSVVRITDNAGNFYALGVIVSKQGFILSDKREFIPNSAYIATFSDGTAQPIAVVAVSESSSLVLFKLQTDDAHLRALVPVVLARTDPQLGQTVVAMEGREKNAIAVGRVLSEDSVTGSALTDIASAAETQGGPLLNLSGELVGLKTSNTDLTLPAGTYMLVSLLSKFIASHS